MSDDITQDAEARPKKRKNKTGANLGKKKGALLGIEQKTFDILSDSLRGLTQREVAERSDVSIVTVDRVLDRWRPIFQRLEETPDYRKAKLRLLEAAEQRLLESVLDESVIAKATLNNRAYSLDIVSKLVTRERGLSVGEGGNKTFITVNILNSCANRVSGKTEDLDTLTTFVNSAPISSLIDVAPTKETKKEDEEP